jgi:hypothetical protein
LSGTIRYYLHYFKNLTKLGYIDILFNRKKFKKFSSSVNDFETNYALTIDSDFLKKIELSDIIKANSINKIIIENWNYRQGNVSLYELYSLSSLAKHFAPKVIFEIGTFDGRTTLHFALNTGDATQINTLDLPPEDLHNVKLKLDSGDPQLVDKKQFRIGECFIDRAESKKITQHLSDSAAFDYSPFAGKVDFFFVDGAHSYEYIKSDTENALKTLSDKGIILWHDYGNVIDVVEYLNDLSKTLPICRIDQTSLAVYSKALFPNQH